MMDGTQTTAWVDRRVGALTEAKIEARKTIMRHTVEEARERLLVERPEFSAEQLFRFYVMNAKPFGEVEA